MRSKDIIYPGLKRITSSTCESCSGLHFEKKGLLAREELSLLESRAESCPLCELLLGLFNMSNTGIAEIWKVRGGLSKYEGGSPDLCIYRMPREYRQSIHKP